MADEILVQGSSRLHANSLPGKESGRLDRRLNVLNYDELRAASSASQRRQLETIYLADERKQLVRYVVRPWDRLQHVIVEHACSTQLGTCY